MSEADVAQRVGDFLRARGLIAPEPRYRYFESTDGWMFGWTVEKVEDDSGREGYQSFVYQPKGPGAQSGRKHWTRRTRMVLVKVVTHSTRKAAKARALRMARARDEEVARRG